MNDSSEKMLKLFKNYQMKQYIIFKKKLKINSSFQKVMSIKSNPHQPISYFEKVIIKYHQN